MTDVVSALVAAEALIAPDATLVAAACMRAMVAVSSQRAGRSRRRGAPPPPGGAGGSWRGARSRRARRPRGKTTPIGRRATPPSPACRSPVVSGTEEKALEPGPILVVNADLPCVAPADLLSLAAATPESGLALVEARDGTTNALSLPGPDAFSPLYGPGSATRFKALAARLGVEAVSAAIPNLADDVDTLDDLYRLRLRCGPRTRACLADLAVEVEG